MRESRPDGPFVAVGAGQKAFLRRGAIGLDRRRKGRAIRLVLGAALLVGAAAGLARFFGGSLFSLQRIQVSGNERARTGDVLRAVEPWRGANLIALDLSAIAHAVRAHPWIARVTLSKRFPDGLSVRVTERKAVALFRDGSGLWWLSSEGRPIAPYDPRADSTEYVLVSGDRGALVDAVGLLSDLHSAPSEYFSALSEISALPDGGFGIMDTIFRRPVRVLRRDAPAKIRALLDARGFIESRGWEARAIDLRFADRIVLVGAYGAGNSL
jgi:cell division protein FtsQ